MEGMLRARVTRGRARTALGLAGTAFAAGGAWLAALALVLAAAPHGFGVQAGPRPAATGAGPLHDGRSAQAADERIPSFDALLRREVRLRPELVGVHPRVFVTAAGIEALRERARTTHREEWRRVLSGLAALQSDPPPPPGPQARRSQNVVAFAIAEASLAWAVERRPELLDAARRWLLAAIDYEPWGYTFNKPNVDLAAGHLLYAVGWAYDLLYHELSEAERGRVRASLERHARLVHDHFAPGAKRRRFALTQNHNFIPTAGLAVTALALLGESAEAPRWAALARAHHEYANRLLSPDGYYYESFEYWIFSAPWLVHFLDAWEHATGESLWELGPYRGWPLYVAHTLLPDGQNAFDFGDIWEGPLTRAMRGQEHGRAFPGGTLQSNYNLLYRVASRLGDTAAQAVAERCRGFGHSNLEEFWTLVWRDPSVSPAPIAELPLRHRFADSGVVFARSSWEKDATAIAFKAGPPEGHRAERLRAAVPEWRPSTGHAHPDAGSFILWARGQYLVGDTGYAGLPAARHHNTLTIGGVGQGIEGGHDVWDGMSAEARGAIRTTRAELDATPLLVEADLTSAYPRVSSLRRLVRRVAFDPSGVVEVEDAVELGVAQPVQWYLHADAPFVVSGQGATTEPGGVGLDVAVMGPAGARLSADVTRLAAPGRPGAIEQGELEARGYELRVESSGSERSLGFRVTLRVRPAPGATGQRP